MQCTSNILEINRYCVQRTPLEVSTGLKLNIEKCYFEKTSLAFLGHIISKDGIKLDLEKSALTKRIHRVSLLLSELNDNENKQVIAYASRTLKPDKKNYPATELETAAVI
ncbi:hypothetical protein G9A89_010448 [Geosiphon pyriformis]|nr:hypothetical protein G9A89_010448 [Geosiphon pyriformis]